MPEVTNKRALQHSAASCLHKVDAGLHSHHQHGTELARQMFGGEADALPSRWEVHTPSPGYAPALSGEVSKDDWGCTYNFHSHHRKSMKPSAPVSSCSILLDAALNSVHTGFLQSQSNKDGHRETNADCYIQMIRSSTTVHCQSPPQDHSS